MHHSLHRTSHSPDCHYRMSDISCCLLRMQLRLSCLWGSIAEGKKRGKGGLSETGRSYSYWASRSIARMLLRLKMLQILTWLVVARVLLPMTTIFLYFTYMPITLNATPLRPKSNRCSFENVGLLFSNSFIALLSP